MVILVPFSAATGRHTRHYDEVDRALE